APQGIRHEFAGTGEWRPYLRRRIFRRRAYGSDRVFEDPLTAAADRRSRVGPTGRVRPARDSGKGMDMLRGVSKAVQTAKQYLSSPLKIKNRFDRLERGQNKLIFRVDQLVDHLERVIGPDERREGRYAPLVAGKRELIDYACHLFPIQSFADIGGNCATPPGGYSFYTIDKYQVPAGYLVDIDFYDEVLTDLGNYPTLRLIEGSVASPDVPKQIDRVDAIYFFDVLFIQVDWKAVLDLYADRAKYFLISNVHFPRLARSVRLMELSKEEYFRHVPHHKDDEVFRELFDKLDEIHPRYNCKYRDVTQFWQWGMTDDDLIAKMKSLGFRLNYAKTMFQREDIQEEAESRALLFVKH